MIQRVLERCRDAKGVDAVVLCADSEQLQHLAEGLGITVLMTSESCSSGSERIASVAHALMTLAWGDQPVEPHRTTVINVQGDQPLLDPTVIEAMVAEFQRLDPLPSVVTPVYAHSPETVHNPNVVKTLLANDGRPLYFSRSAIPDVRDVAHKIGTATPPTRAMWGCTNTEAMCWRPGISYPLRPWRILSGSSSFA